MSDKHYNGEFIAIFMIVVFVVHTALAERSEMVLILERSPETCEGFDESKFVIDFSNLEFIQTDDYKFTTGGSITITETIEAPIELSSETMQEVNSMWVPALPTASWEDICKMFADPSIMFSWIGILQPLTKNGSCPFIKGTYNYDGLEIKSFSNSMKNMPHSLAGKWRTKMQYKKNNKTLSCNNFYFECVRT